MSRPPRPAPLTRASPLPRAGPPAHPATVLSTSPSRRPGALPLAPATQEQYQHAPSRVPHPSRRPGSRHLHAGHRLASNTGIPPGSSQGGHYRPGPDAVFCSRRSSGGSLAFAFPVPPDSSHAAFPHRSAPQSSARAPCGALTPPPAGQRRRTTKPSSRVQLCRPLIASYDGGSFPRTRRKMPGT